MHPQPSLAVTPCRGREGAAHAGRQRPAASRGPPSAPGADRRRGSRLGGSAPRSPLVPPGPHRGDRAHIYRRRAVSDMDQPRGPGRASARRAGARAWLEVTPARCRAPGGLGRDGNSPLRQAARDQLQPGGSHPAHEHIADLVMVADGKAPAQTTASRHRPPSRWGGRSTVGSASSRPGGPISMTSCRRRRSAARAGGLGGARDLTAQARTVGIGVGVKGAGQALQLSHLPAGDGGPGGPLDGLRSGP